MLCLSALSVAQQRNQVPGNDTLHTRHPDTTLVHRIVQKLTDSLELSNAQRRDVYRVTAWIDSCKIAVIHTWHGRPSFNVYMGRLERMRDSLYSRVLTPAQYVRYGQKKQKWVLNN
jgi:hypothetical protein